ncbi:hypothetical protein QN362_14430 [Actimicrobium sp. CCC2.4]|nr:hypothetical protein [Actimicrobium sp. CCC2.4]MEB0136533.1 hypothetical protein [Actimicrobium sp. CCC2.4]WPX34235.1 hypothetical protein RHM62_11520 [Actimicrobium sp. CCC2.4]
MTAAVSHGNPTYNLSMHDRMNLFMVSARVLIADTDHGACAE